LILSIHCCSTAPFHHGSTQDNGIELLIVYEKNQSLPLNDLANNDSQTDQLTGNENRICGDQIQALFHSSNKIRTKIRKQL
jgi:hypothetical protein